MKSVDNMNWMELSKEVWMIEGEMETCPLHEHNSCNCAYRALNDYEKAVLERHAHELEYDEDDDF